MLIRVCIAGTARTLAPAEVCEWLQEQETMEHLMYPHDPISFFSCPNKYVCGMMSLCMVWKEAFSAVHQWGGGGGGLIWTIDRKW